MYEEETFKESDIAGYEFAPENIVFEWLSEELHKMIKEQGELADSCDDEEHCGYYKITIERFDSKKELEQNQERMDRFI